MPRGGEGEQGEERSGGEKIHEGGEKSLLRRSRRARAVDRAGVGPFRAVESFLVGEVAPRARSEGIATGVTKPGRADHAGIAGGALRNRLLRLQGGPAVAAEDVSGVEGVFAGRAFHLLRRGMLNDSGQIPFDHGFRSPEKKTGGAEPQDVPVGELALGDPVPVQKRAVRGLAIVEEIFAPVEDDAGVPPRDQRVRDHHIVGGVATNGQIGLGKVDFLPRGHLRIDDQLRQNLKILLGLSSARTCTCAAPEPEPSCRLSGRARIATSGCLPGRRRRSPEMPTP